MHQNAADMVLVSLAADALALGPHWIYDTGEIEQKAGRVESLRDPMAGYHKGKKAGDFTHYGDQTMVLLESVAAHDGFDAEDFSTRWREFFTDNDTTYVDSATRTTMRNLGEGDPFMEAGSSSHDLAGAGRIGPLVYCYRSQPDPLVDAARTQTRLTHNNDIVVAAADFFAKVAVACLDNVHPVEAMRTTAEHDDIAPIRKMVEQGIGAVEEESTAYIAKVGQACPAERALPATVQLIARYAENGREALIQNVMAGGDSAGRGLLVGLVLGAYQGRDAADPAWIEGMSARDRALELLGKMS